MKVYKFIFLIGLVNLIIPFLGITFLYKQYILVALACVTIAYALILRAIIKEKEHFKATHTAKASTPTPPPSPEPKTIHEVVEMKEEIIPIPEIKPKKQSSRKKILVSLDPQHD